MKGASAAGKTRLLTSVAPAPAGTHGSQHFLTPLSSPRSSLSAQGCPHTFFKTCLSALPGASYSSTCTCLSPLDSGVGGGCGETQQNTGTLFSQRKKHGHPLARHFCPIVVNDALICTLFIPLFSRGVLSSWTFFTPTSAPRASRFCAHPHSPSHCTHILVAWHHRATPFAYTLLHSHFPSAFTHVHTRVHPCPH